MKAELEQIAECDEKARTRVQAAEAEAGKIMEDARSRVEHLKSGMEKQVVQVRQEEIEPVLREAEERARKVEADAHAYMERLRERVEKHRDVILNNFMSNVLGTSWSPDKSHAESTDK